MFGIFDSVGKKTFGSSRPAAVPLVPQMMCRRATGTGPPTKGFGSHTKGLATNLWFWDTYQKHYQRFGATTKGFGRFCGHYQRFWGHYQRFWGHYQRFCPPTFGTALPLPLARANPGCLPKVGGTVGWIPNTTTPIAASMEQFPNPRAQTEKTNPLILAHV